MQTGAGTGFGVLLRRYRASAGLSQEALAERAGLSRRGIADLERGARSFPYGYTIRRLADALELAPEERGALLAAGQPQQPARERSLTALGTPMAAAKRWPLIGRDREFMEIRGRLLDAAALVTVVGPGGVGKTRLVASVADSLVVQATAEALGLRIELDRDRVATIVAYLRDRHALLVLDNCEHLIQACAALAAVVVKSCPRVQLLL